MKKYTLYHHLRVSDDDTIDVVCFDGKLPYKKNNDPDRSLAAKTAKDDGASENYVKREIVEKLSKKGAVLEVRDGGGMIVETANDKVEDDIERRQQIRLILKLRDDGCAYTGWFTVCDVKGFDIILWKQSVLDINGTYHINHQSTEMCITHSDISWDARENAA